MVIQKFNKLIRNKWLWGAFAILVSAAFCFEGLFDTRRPDERREIDAGSFAGEPIAVERLEECVKDEQRDSGTSRTSEEINLAAVKKLAALETAEKAGIAVSDEMLAERIFAMFGGREGFSSSRYRAMAAQFGWTVEDFEARLRRSIAVDDGLKRSLLFSSVWTSPMELERDVEDANDEITVRIVPFRQTKAEADAVKLDDAGLKKWYDANVKKLELPDLVRIRFVKYSSSDTNVLARMVVSEDDMRDRYDADIASYTSTDTNGVETVKKFEEVKPAIEKQLRKAEAIYYYETNLTRRAYADRKAGEGAVSRLDEIAAADGKKVETSGWFALGGEYVEGFTVRRESVLPGASNFAAALSEVDPDSEDLRYGVVSSDSSTWLFERCDFAKAHTPSFEEAKDKIKSAALRDAKSDAFKAAVEKIVAQGVDALLKRDGVSTNIVFTAAETMRGAFPDSAAVVPEAVKLAKGEVSSFIKTGPGRAVVVYVADRKHGDAVKAIQLRRQLRASADMAEAVVVAETWDERNLERLGFVPGADYPVKAVSEADAESVP